MSFKSLHQKQFIQFLFFSGIAATVNFSSRILIGKFTPYTISVILAYCCGMAVAFTFNKFIVFTDSKRSTHQQMWGFAIVNLFGIALTTGVSSLGYHYLFTGVSDVFLRKEISHFIGILTPAITSFFGHKYWSFKPS